MAPCSLRYCAINAQPCVACYWLLIPYVSAGQPTGITPEDNQQIPPTAAYIQLVSCERSVQLRGPAQRLETEWNL